MRPTTSCGARVLRSRKACKLIAGILAASALIAISFTGPFLRAADSKSEGVLPTPSPGKAIVCIYRTYRFTGSASHDEIFINDTHTGKLLSSEYEFLEVPPGTVVIAGLPKMYYGSVTMSIGAALNQARQKENERVRFEAEAGKTYYFKWTAGTMATMIKVTPIEASVGAKEIRKLHLSKPPDDKDGQPETKSEAKPSAP